MLAGIICLLASSIVSPIAQSDSDAPGSVGLDEYQHGCNTKKLPSE